ncbi:MAG: mannose-6-phosphate isomerase, class I [Chitinophagia bacterium]|jgi:mannose-6-phosphate isomerase
MQKAYKLQGKHKHYDWGGTSFLPNLMGIENVNHLPYAEYWMGAHPSAVAMVSTAKGEMELDVLVKEDPSKWLGAHTFQKFSTVPYLFKILDVKNMLSIQVHPSKENAVIGFDKEQAAGIPISAANRNYKDKNHKPEVMVALSDFWLLHGFLPPEVLEERLHTYLPLRSLINEFKGGDYKHLYTYFMQLPMEASDQILKQLLLEATVAVNNRTVTKSDPHYWAHKYYADGIPVSNIDKGIFSIYILNIVQLPKYHGIFQGAGLLHAYLEGQNIELMANSDNVLRGGLTSKHVDIQELIQHVKFIPTYPTILNGETIHKNETNYPCLTADFGLTKITLNEGESYTIKTHSLEMLLVMEGVVLIDQLSLKAGETAVVEAESRIQIKAQQTAVLFKSFVPQ